MRQPPIRQLATSSHYPGNRTGFGFVPLDGQSAFVCCSHGRQVTQLPPTSAPEGQADERRNMKVFALNFRLDQEGFPTSTLSFSTSYMDPCHARHPTSYGVFTIQDNAGTPRDLGATAQTCLPCGAALDADLTGWFSLSRETRHDRLACFQLTKSTLPMSLPAASASHYGLDQGFRELIQRSSSH
jgi:hypothetical protein